MVRKNDFYIEIQNNGLDSRPCTPEAARTPAARHPLVATADAHYCQEDAEAHDALFCNQHRKWDPPTELPRREAGPYSSAPGT